MLALQFLNLIIGLVFIYFIFSQVSNALFEIVAQMFKLRARTLKTWILSTFATDVYNKKSVEKNMILGHGFFETLCSKDNKFPSYLDKSDFARVLIDSICKQSNKYADSLRSIEAAIEESPLLPDDIKRILRLYAQEAKAKAGDRLGHELIYFRESIEKWFDSAMDRVGGTYRRRARFWTGWFAFIMVFALNIDTLSLANYLYGNPEAVAALNIQADQVLAGNNALVKKISNIQTIDSTVSVGELSVAVKDQTAVLKDVVSSLKDQGLPIGWKMNSINDVWAIIFNVNKVLGLLISAIAISMGSPFWFQMLNRLASLRSAGAKPDGEDKAVG